MSGSGTKRDAFQNYGLGSNENKGLYGSALGIGSELTPQLESQAIHPQGMAPTDLAAANTSAQQSAGGSQAGAVGQGALLASRTKNAGTADAAIAKSAESAGGNLSKAAVGTTLANASLKNQQQSGAQRELGSLYGTDLNASVGSLGASNQALGEANNAKDSFWTWYLKNQIQVADQAAGAAAGGA